MMRIAILSFLVIFMSCASVHNSLTTTEISNLKEKINSKNIEVTFDRAQSTGLNNIRGFENLLPPGSSASAISLMGNSNFFRIKKDSIYMDLPYYGRRQMAGGYNSDGGIKYNGKAPKVEKIFNDKKGAYILRYSLKSKSENYDIVLTLFENNKSHLNVSSSHRTNINYHGNWRVVKESAK